MLSLCGHIRVILIDPLGCLFLFGRSKKVGDGRLRFLATADWYPFNRKSLPYGNFSFTEKVWFRDCRESVLHGNRRSHREAYFCDVSVVSTPPGIRTLRKPQFCAGANFRDCCTTFAPPEIRGLWKPRFRIR